jgi:hypothetical protein
MNYGVQTQKRQTGHVGDVHLILPLSLCQPSNLDWCDRGFLIPGLEQPNQCNSGEVGNGNTMPSSHVESLN